MTGVIKGRGICRNAALHERWPRVQGDHERGGGEGDSPAVEVLLDLAFAVAAFLGSTPLHHRGPRTACADQHVVLRLLILLQGLVRLSTATCENEATHKENNRLHVWKDLGAPALEEA